MKNALIVIDLINELLHPEGKITSSAKHAQEQQLIPHANQALAHARASGWLTVLVKVGFESNYLAQPKNSPMFGKAQQFEALKLGSFGTEFHQDLDVKSTDFIIEKPRVSAFYGTALEPVLRANSVEHLFLCGVSSSWAIQSAAREGHDRDYQITIIEDACAAASDEEHQRSMQLLSRIAHITTAGELQR